MNFSNDITTAQFFQGEILYLFRFQAVFSTNEITLKGEYLDNFSASELDQTKTVIASSGKLDK